MEGYLRLQICVHHMSLPVCVAQVDLLGRSWLTEQTLSTRTLILANKKTQVSYNMNVAK